MPSLHWRMLDSMPLVCYKVQNDDIYTKLTKKQADLTVFALDLAMHLLISPSISHPTGYASVLFDSVTSPGGITRSWSFGQWCAIYVRDGGHILKFSRKMMILPYQIWWGESPTGTCYITECQEVPDVEYKSEIFTITMHKVDLTSGWSSTFRIIWTWSYSLHLVILKFEVKGQWRKPSIDM